MAVTGTLPTTSSTTTTGTNTGIGGITGTDFMNLLIKQLQYQDPLQPMTNQEMMQQMSTIRQLETNTELSTKLQQITDQERFGSAAALIGQHVKGTVTDENGNQFPMEGVVQSVLFTPEGNVMLELESGDTLPLANLEQVMSGSTATTTNAATTAKLIAQARNITPTTAAKGIAKTLAHAIGL